jgi:uncharacterized damage-inducible protein DinB
MSGTSTIIELFKWNLWANERYRGTLRDMSLDELKIETPYGVLLDRIVHIFASFNMWFQRMNGGSPQSVIKANDFSTWSELESKWIEYDNLLLDYVSGLKDEELNNEVEYTSLDGTVYKRKINHILMHLTAHPNYHRGQISAIFKMKDLSSLPSTDMVLYFLNN